MQDITQEDMINDKLSQMIEKIKEQKTKSLRVQTEERYILAGLSRYQLDQVIRFLDSYKV